MTFPGVNFDPSTMYFPDPLGVKELNLGDAWRAVWIDSAELPADVPAPFAYAVVVCDGKGYVTRPAGEGRWAVVEGDLPAGENPLASVKRAALGQAGAMGGRADLVGYFDCKATSYNTEFPLGARAVRPIYLFIAKSMKDIGKASGFERRRLPLNEFARALRDSYPELGETIMLAVDRYSIMHARGEA